MSLRSAPWPAGTPCWVDLATPDVDTAQEFYAAMLGWSFPPLEQDYGGYVIGTVDGAAAAGIGPLQGDQQRPSWTLYLASDDASRTEAAVSEHGGTVLVPAGDVGDLGRMCIAADPSGAVFGVWQAGTHIGASWVNDPGGLVWEDLRSTDPERAREFYGLVFGHRFEELPEAGPDYSTFHLTSSGTDQLPPLGGMGGMFGAPEGTPSHWLIYFSVADTDAAVKEADAHGGQVVVPAFSSTYGRMAGVADPAGAVCWLMSG
jgi:predicted enzyme related to lactoylglutathione lyase